MRRALAFLFIVFILIPAAAVLASLQRTPLVAEKTEATPEVARATRDLVRRVRAATSDDRNIADLVVRPTELDAAIAFTGRVVPGLRGRAAITPEGGRVRVSLPVPWLGERLWLNIEAVAPPFEGRPELSSVRVGPFSLPPQTALDAGVTLANIALGQGAGDRILDSVVGMQVKDDRVVATLRMDSAERGSLTRRLAGALRGEEMPTAEEIQVYYVGLRDAIESGRLSTSGSFLPYLRFMVEQALAHAAPGREDYEFTASLFATAMLCGASDFQLVVGKLIDGAKPEDRGHWKTNCNRVRFRDRIDTKRHFVTAAAIETASTRDIAFRVGEFKELVDIITSSGGFDFTDIVANNSGIRFARTFLETDPARWPELIARMKSEDDVLAPFDGVPGILPRKDFVARFGKVDSPAYLAMVDRIEASIDRLPLHAPPGPS